MTKDEWYFNMRFRPAFKDGTANAQQSFEVTVNEVNAAPTLGDPADGSVDELVAISRTLVGADTDLPAQTLTYSVFSGCRASSRGSKLKPQLT